MSQQPNPNSEDSQGHPAWDPYLKDVPEEFHEYVTKAFRAWDDAVVPKSKVQELEEQYGSYKDFIDNEVDADVLNEALAVRQSLEQNPEEFIKRAVEIFGLDNLLASAGNSSDNDEDEDEDYDMDDISKNPVVVALQKQLEEVTGKLSTREQTEAEAQQAKEFDEYLDGLKTTYKDAGEFDESIVSGLIGAGWDGDEAVKHYFKIFGSANQAPNPSDDQPPVVMGGDGQTGSGLPDTSTKMGDLTRNDLEDAVIQFLNNAEKE